VPDFTSRFSENDLERLVHWAHDAHDFTTNKVVKPSLIYIVNQDPNAIFSDWKDVSIAATKMMQKWRSSRRFQDLQKTWRDRGAQVDTADQLLYRYYRDVKVVSIPEFKTGKQQVCNAEELQEQYGRLYSEIGDLSSRSARPRKGAGMEFNLETLSRLNMSVLEQLGKDPSSSVDLRSLAQPLQPYPTNFNSHVLNVLS
jgi:hypothetical protein